MDGTNGAAAALVVIELHKRFGQLEVLKGVSLTAHERRRDRDHRRIGLRQEHVPALHQPARDPGRGRGPVAGELIRMSRARRHGARPADRQAGRPHPHRLGMVFQSFNLWSHMTVLENVIEAPVHVLKRPQGRGGRPGRGAARQGRHRRQAPTLSGPSLGRPAAARRDRPRARHGAAGDAVRRADLGARPGAGRRGPEGDARARRGGPHHADRDPRDGLRPRGLDQHGLPPPGPDRGRRAPPRRSSATRARNACASSSPAICKPFAARRERRRRPAPACKSARSS